MNSRFSSKIVRFLIYFNFSFGVLLLIATLFLKDWNKHF